MDKLNMLSGDQLVAKGITKIEATLPEIGLKDILPNGSWLEQKQIQAALEARKHLVEIERIEKCGSISHAEWREDLMLAEVTRKIGSYWQYMGHNVGKLLFLQPEEALFLMEINSLLLKHNDITVSLQKAYALLLGETISIDQYKVYASLSRLGYRVFRHKDVELNKENKTSIIESHDDNATEEGSENKRNDQHNTRSEDSPIASSIQAENTNNPQITEANNLSKDSDDTSSVIIEDTNMATCDNFNSPESVSRNAFILVESGKMPVNIIEKDDNLNEKPEENNETNEIVCIDSKNSNVVDSGIYSIEDEDDGKTRHEVSHEMEVDMVEIDGTSSANRNIAKDKDGVPESTICNNRNSVNNRKPKSLNNISEYIPYYYLNKIQKLQNRQFEPCNMNNADKYFENIPNFCNNHTVTVKVPQEQFLPKNIYVNNISYILNIEKIQRKCKRPASNESSTYSVSDEANDINVRRVSNSSEIPQQTRFMNARFPRQNHFRPYNFWRPRMNLGFYRFSLYLQRPYLQPTFFPPRAHFQTFRPQSNVPGLFINHNYNNSDASNLTNESNHARKRNLDDAKTFHLQAIKNLAMRLKTLCQSGNVQSQNFSSLNRLLHIYNTRYNEAIILTDNLDIINNKSIIETIELDDGEESNSKKPRLEYNVDEFDKHVNKFKTLAAKLKVLESQNKSSARHRRAFSNALKIFNKSYNADIYLNSDYEIIDRKFITLDSSSESDGVVEEHNNVQKGKKLRNPFNILKRLSEKLNTQLNNPSTSKGIVEDDINAFVIVEDNKYSERIKNTFDKTWLPDYEDFGRAELVPQHLMNIRLLDTNKEEYLYNFMKSPKQHWINWKDVKISFSRHIQETHVVFQREQAAQENVQTESATGLKPLIGPDDCTDMKSILNKLRIIQTNHEVSCQSSLNIDFDVYNRDVQNFRKTSRPKPHFRIICKNESTSFPTAEDVTALRSKYKDNIAVVFAVVGVGSVSYLQINPTDLPVYIPSTD